MKKLIWSIGVGLFVVILITVGKNAFSYHFYEESNGMQAAIHRETIDSIFIGSSMFRQGIDIYEAEESLDGTTFVLTYNGNQPVMMLEELEYMVDNGLTIKNLYVDLYPYNAAVVPWISDVKMLWDSDFGFKVDVWNILNDYNKVNVSEAYEWFFLANNEYMLTYPINSRVVSSMFHDGGSTVASAGKTKEELDATPTLGTREGTLDIQMESFVGIADFAKEHDINMIYLETPKYQKTVEDETYQMLLNDTVQLCEDNDIPYLLAKDLEFDSTNAAYFQDLIHLSSKGRTEYTKLLLQKIKNTE